MDVETKSDGYWLWFLSKEIRNNGFHHAKINLRLIGNNTEHVLCLYYKDNSRKHELAKKYQGKVKYRYCKSDKDTLKGKYSKEFLSKLIPCQQKEFQRVKREIVFTHNKGRLIMRQRKDDSESD